MRGKMLRWRAMAEVSVLGGLVVVTNSPTIRLTLRLFFRTVDACTAVKVLEGWWAMQTARGVAGVEAGLTGMVRSGGASRQPEAKLDLATLS